MQNALSPPSSVTPSVGTTNSVPAISSVTGPVARPSSQSALKRSQYFSAPHGSLLENELDNTPDDNIFLVSYRIVPGSAGHFWFLNVGFKYVNDNNNKMTLLLGLTALMEILPGVINGFELHPLNETSTLLVLTSTCVKEGFPSSAILAFKYCHVKNKLPCRGNSQQTKSFYPPAPSPYRYNNDNNFSPPSMLYAVIRIHSKDNIKVACKEISWDISETGLQIWYKEHQSADSNAQILLMCVPNVFDQEGVEGEILWHFAEIEKSLLKKGALPAEFFGEPLPEIRVSWHQNK
jgi:hypothetical protein